MHLVLLRRSLQALYMALNDRIAQTRTQLQMSYNHTWNILGYVLNGFVFSILGFLVPEVIVKIIKTEPHNLLFLIVITVLVALAVSCSDLCGSMSFILIFIYQSVHSRK